MSRDGSSIHLTKLWKIRLLLLVSDEKLRLLWLASGVGYNMVVAPLPACERECDGNKMARIHETLTALYCTVDYLEWLWTMGMARGLQTMCDVENCTICSWAPPTEQPAEVPNRLRVLASEAGPKPWCFLYFWQISIHKHIHTHIYIYIYIYVYIYLSM